MQPFLMDINAELLHGPEEFETHGVSGSKKKGSWGNGANNQNLRDPGSVIFSHPSHMCCLPLFGV